MKLISLSMAALLLMLHLYTYAQRSSAVDQPISIPEEFFSKVSKKSLMLDLKLQKETQKYLRSLLNKEKKLMKQFQRIDSAVSKELFSDIDKQYAASGELLDQAGAGGNYMPHVDSLKTALAFFQVKNVVGGSVENIREKALGSLKQVNQFQSKLAQSSRVQDFVSQRRELIRKALDKYVAQNNIMKRTYADFSKECYYYSQQVREYKAMLNDPDQLTRKVLDVVSKTQGFREFMSRHSELASLFGIPTNYGTPQVLVGMQTRTQVQQVIQTQLSGPNAQQFLQQSVQGAQQQLSEIKEKLLKLNDNGGGDPEMPDFKPNSQKTKTFLKRLEFGTNVQSVKSNFYFPATTDIGLSVGYRLNDKTTFGVGASYKMGWGKDIRHIVVTTEGAGLRSFFDLRLKRSFFASAGYEYNYQPAIVNGNTSITTWSQSGLVGLSKVVAMKSKFFKKTRVQVLWDFLSYRQQPQTQQIKFRIGYNF